MLRALLILMVTQPAPAPTPPGPPPPPVVVEIPPPPVPWTEVAVPVATRVKLLTTDGKAATWALIDDAASLDEIGGAAHFFAPAAGRYRVLAYQPDRGFTRLLLVAGTPPKPPGPDPVPPGPTPPGPPAPPNPGDPVVDKLRAAVAANTDADKAAAVKDLAAVFQVAARFARSPAVATTADLIKRVGDTADAMLPAGKLRNVREVIAADLEATFPDDGMPLDDAFRDKVIARFNLYVLALGQ